MSQSSQWRIDMAEISTQFSDSPFDLGYHLAMLDLLHVYEKSKSDEEIALEVQKRIHFYIDACKEEA